MKIMGEKCGVKAELQDPRDTHRVMWALLSLGREECGVWLRGPPRQQRASAGNVKSPVGSSHRSSCSTKRALEVRKGP